MSTVDSRIVTMKFDNTQFERGAQQTMHTMDNLSKSMAMPGAASGLAAAQAAVDKFSFGTMEGGITKISAGFMAMATVAITALTNITNKAISTGTQVVKSLTLDPVKAGFDEYELKMGSIQTIMAGSGESLDVVNKKLQELNTYSDQTIYSFKDMTSNIGKFTNAGVSLEDSVAAIKGVANVAALSGANAEEASRSMYNFAQSLSSGAVRLADWKSIELANMATVEFKEELLKSAEAAGKLTKTGEGMYKVIGGNGDVISATKGFNDSLQEEWLTSEALTKTLGRYADATTDIGKRATAAATEVKTFSQMMDTIKESAGSGWASTFEIIFGNFDEAKKLWTGVNNVISGMIGKSAEARNKVLQDWKDLGGRDVLLQSLKQVFQGLMGVITPIKEAFREIFPAKTGRDLYQLTVAFRNFTDHLRVSEETANNIKRTFKGVFAVFSIFKQIVSGIIGVIGDLVGAIFKGDGGFLRMTGNIGDILVKIDEFLKKGDKLKNFFEILGAVLSSPIVAIKALTGFIMDLFGSFGDGTDKAGGALDAFKERLGSVGDAILKVWDSLGGLGDLFKKLWAKMQPFFDWLGEQAGKLGEALGEAFSGGDFSVVFDAINTGLFAGLVLMFKKFFGGGLFGGADSIVESITGSFNALTGTLESLQAKVQAETLIRIAIAVAILAASILVLSLIDSNKLAAAMAAITVAFTELMIAMKIMEKISGNKAVAKMSVIAFSLILLSTALLILSHAVQNLGEMSWSELTKGLLGLAAMLTILIKAIEPLSKKTGSMIKAAIGIGILGIALKIMVSVIKDFSEMDLTETAKGMAILAVALGGIAGAMKLMPNNIMWTAAGLAVLSISLKIIANVIKDLAGLSWEGVARGVAGLGGALVSIALAMRLMPKNMMMQAISLVILGEALQTIGQVLADMGGMEWDEVARGLVALGGSLLIIAIALNLMKSTLPGAAALIIAAGALAILAGVIKTLGSMELGDVIQGLIALAAVFVILGVAGYVLAPVIPIIVLLGLALFGIGAAILFAGAGVLMFVTALTILVGLGSAAALAIGAILSVLISKIPEAMRAFGDGIVAFADAISRGYTAFYNAFKTIMDAILDTIIEEAPKIKDAFVAMVSAMLDGVIELTPKFGETARTVLNEFLDTVVEETPKIINTGIFVLMSILTGIRNNIYRIITVATQIITEFLRGIGDNAPKVAQEGAKTVIKLIDGISDAIDDNSEEMGRAGGRLAVSIIKGMVKGLKGGVTEIKNAAIEAAKGALDGALGFLGIKSPSKKFIEVGKAVDEGFALGITTYSKIVNNSVVQMGDSAVDTMKTTMQKVSDAATMNVDTNPVIAPVLDLTQVEKDAQKLNDMIPTGALPIETTYDKANAIALDQLASKEALQATAEQQPSTLVNFEQNNYSPTALSSVDIYRQTKNQLSLAKEALNV